MMDPETIDSEFVCPDCGVREASVAVSYDRFGYAVCPNCGASARPTPSLDSGEFRWTGDVLGD